MNVGVRELQLQSPAYTSIGSTRSDRVQDEVARAADGHALNDARQLQAEKRTSCRHTRSRGSSTPRVDVRPLRTPRSRTGSYVDPGLKGHYRRDIIAEVGSSGWIRRRAFAKATVRADDGFSSRMAPERQQTRHFICRAPGRQISQFLNHLISRTPARAISCVNSPVRTNQLVARVLLGAPRSHHD